MKGFILLIGGIVLVTLGIGFYFTFNPIKQTKPQQTGIFENLNKTESCYLKARTTKANPATIFCTCMGGKWRLLKTPQGENGKCKIEGVDREYDEWEYFRKLNPNDNTLQKFEGQFNDWINFCKRNKKSIYCVDNYGNSLVE
jgi:putative hemolysin